MQPKCKYTFHGKPCDKQTDHFGFHESSGVHSGLVWTTSVSDNYAAIQAEKMETVDNLDSLLCDSVPGNSDSY